MLAKRKSKSGTIFMSSIITFIVVMSIVLVGKDQGWLSFAPEEETTVIRHTRTVNEPFEGTQLNFIFPETFDLEFYDEFDNPIYEYEYMSAMFSTVLYSNNTFGMSAEYVLFAHPDVSYHMLYGIAPSQSDLELWTSDDDYWLSSKPQTVYLPVSSDVYIADIRLFLVNSTYDPGYMRPSFMIYNNTDISDPFPFNASSSIMSFEGNAAYNVNIGSPIKYYLNAGGNTVRYALLPYSVNKVSYVINMTTVVLAGFI